MSLVDNNSLSVVPYASKSSAIEQSRLYMQESLKARMQSVMDDSFRAQFRDYNHFRQYGMGDIVVLVGTSTAGKTSIIKALQQLESDRLEDGGDLRCDVIDLKVMTKYNPNEIEILRRVMKTPLDIPKAVGSIERSWKTGITSQEKIEAEEAIQKIKERGEAFSSKEKEELNSLFQNRELEMFDDAFEHSRRGGNVIFDVLNIDILAQHLLMRNFDGPLRAVLTYCPFHVLSSRMEKRNKEAVESGELSNQRIGEFPLMQFSEIYTQKEKGQVAVERLTRKQVTKAFNENFDNGTEANRETARIEGRKFPSEKELSKEKAKSLANFLANLGFKEGIDVVEVAPKNQRFYHLFINSSKLLPTESAKIIHGGTYQRY
jgi:hypothetical protein